MLIPANLEKINEYEKNWGYIHLYTQFKWNDKMLIKTLKYSKDEMPL